MIDSSCRARLADFGLAVVTDESTANNRGMRGTIRWMAPELMCPEEFGFTSEYQKQLPSRSTDTYALGMTILEVSAFTSRSHALKYFTTFCVGHYWVPPVREYHEGCDCYVQSPERGTTGQTTKRALGPIVGVIINYLARRTMVSSSQTSVDLHNTQSAQ